MAAKKSSDTNARPNAKELRTMGVEDLQKTLAEHREQIMQMRFNHATAKLENTADLKAMRKQIARISTILNEKEQRA
ncbi:MAG: 50S ribosomal protein L29 [Desulfovibrio sp.]|nr:50S ribosomal protein L29 [Desulfovibrio sp.]